MKHVIAFIQDRKLAQVTHALHGIEGLTGMTASSVRGFGRTRHGEGSRELTSELELLAQRVRLDIFCVDDLIEVVVETIRSTTHTGLRGDGKVYVAPIEDALRIETGERGERAV
ncbi:MAG: P-II family nitrogen regulator [Myxococcota bacterium]